MLTEDITLADQDQWVALVPTGASIVVYNGSNRDCVIRFGALSTSAGMLFGPDETIIAEETVYVKPKNTISGKIGTVRITR